MSEITDTGTLSQAQQSSQELHDLIEIVRVERRKFFKNQILIDVVKEVAKHGKKVDVESAMCNKVYSTLMTAEVNSCGSLHPSSYEATSSVFGFGTSVGNELTFEESVTLKRILESEVTKKCDAVIREFSKTTMNNCGSVCNVEEQNLNLNVEDRVWLELIQQLNSQKELYVNSSVKYAEILKEMIKLRTEKLPQVMEAQIAKSKVTMDMNELRSKLLHEGFRVDIFTELPCSFGAYKMVLGDIRTLQRQYKEDIQKLQELKEKYRQVKCKQFNEILKDYLHYKSETEKKNLLYDQITK